MGEWVHPMKRGNLRFVDGRVREVVKVLRESPLADGKVQRVELLSCGHEKAPNFGQGIGGTPKYQWRLCFQCRPFAEARP